MDRDRADERSLRLETLIIRTVILRARAEHTRLQAHDVLQHATNLLRDGKHAQERRDLIRRTTEALDISKASVTDPAEFERRRRKRA